MYSLDEIVQFPPLQLGAGAAGDPTVQTATQQAAWRAFVVEVHKVRFGALTRAAAVKVRAHSPATVIRTHHLQCGRRALTMMCIIAEVNRNLVHLRHIIQ